MGNSVKLTWHTEKRRLGDLIEWDKNPRQLKDHDAEHLKKSLDNFGVDGLIYFLIYLFCEVVIS